MKESGRNLFVRLVQGLRIEIAIHSGDSEKVAQMSKRYGKPPTEQWMYAVEADAIAGLSGAKDISSRNATVISKLAEALPKQSS